VTVTNHKDRKDERVEYDVLFSLSAVLKAVQQVQNLTDIYRVLSEELAVCGFQNIVLRCEGDKAAIIGFQVPQKTVKSVEKLQGIPAQEMEIRNLPHYDEIKDDTLVLSDFGQILIQILDIPAESLRREYSPPANAILVPLLQHGTILVVASDKLTKDELPIFLAFRNLLEDIISAFELLRKTRKKEELSQQIMENITEAVMTEDAQGIITFVNPKGQEFLEREKGEIIGHHWQEFIAVECILKSEAVRKAGGTSGQYETTFLTKSGRQVPALVSTISHVENDQFTGCTSLCVDLSVAKEQEKEIRQKTEDLQLLSRINFALNKGKDLKSILDMAILEIQRIFHSDYVTITFLEKNKKRFDPERLAFSPKLDQILGIKGGETELSYIIQKGSIVEKVVNKKESYLVQDEKLKDFFQNMVGPDTLTRIREQARVRSVIALPLVVEDETIGIMIIGSVRELNQTDLSRSKSLSRHLALAIHHAWLDESLQKTSQELHKHLLEQTLLRELVEKLYAAENQKEVVDFVADGLEQLGYQYFGVALKEMNYISLVKVHPEKSIQKVTECLKEITDSPPHLDRIHLPDDKYLYREVGKRRAALVTNNILLHKEHVISVSLKDFVQLWVGKDEHLQESVFHVLPLQSAICIPFQVERELVGAFVVGSETVLMHHDFVVLETLGQVINEALEKLQYSKTLEKKSQDLIFSNQQLNLLQEISNALNSTIDLDEILRILVRGINSVFKYSTASIYLLSDDREHLLIKEFDIDSEFLKKLINLVKFPIKNYKIPLFEGSRLKRVIDEKTPLITDDVVGFIKDFTEKEGLRKLAGSIYRMGGSKWATALPLLANNNPVGILAFGSDEKIEKEDIDALNGFLNQAALAIAKAKMYEELRDASQMRSDFIDIASHELRTPLTSIKLYLEMIEMGRYGEISPELQEKIKVLQASAERLKEIIDQILVSSAIIKDKLKLKKKAISIPELVHEVMVQLRPLWEARKQKIDIQGPYKFSQVEADREALWNVITALLDNAIKYSPEESRITVKFYDHPTEIEIAIMDEGIGIKQEYQKKIFEEFFIVPAETEYAYMNGRTGLGLFITKGIIEAHGGKIWVESVYGLGSTFYFTLPK
jgi:PAS domain S-box-containing protein